MNSLFLARYGSGLNFQCIMFIVYTVWSQLKTEKPRRIALSHALNVTPSHSSSFIHAGKCQKKIVQIPYTFRCSIVVKSERDLSGKVVCTSETAPKIIRHFTPQANATYYQQMMTMPRATKLAACGSACKEVEYFIKNYDIGPGRLFPCCPC